MSCLIRKGWRDLVKSRWQALGIALLVSIVTILVVGGAHTRSLLAGTVDGWYERLRMSDLQINCFPTHRGAIDYVKDVPGIVQMEERLLLEGVWVREKEREATDDADEKKKLRDVPSLIRVLPPGGQPKICQLEILEGRLPKEGEKAVVIDRSLGAEFKKGLGETIEIDILGHRLELPVVGVALSPEHVLHPVHPEYPLPLKGMVAVLYTSDATLEGIEHSQRINSLLFRFTPGTDVEATKAALLSNLPVSVAQVKTRAQEPGRIVTNWIVNTFDIYMPAIGLMCVLVAMTLLILTHVRIVKRQETTIGTLAALGHRTWSITRGFLALAVIPTVLGLVIGGFLQREFAMRLFGGYAESVGFAPAIDQGAGVTLPATIIVCVLVSLAACAFPAVLISRARPATLLRPVQWRLMKNRQSWLVRAAARLRDVLRLPISVVLGLTNVARQRWATVCAVLGLGSIFALVLSFLMVHFTHLSELESSVERMGLDATVVFREPTDEAGVAAIAAASQGEAEPFISRIAMFDLEKGPIFRRVLGAPPGMWTKKLSMTDGRIFTDPWAQEIVVDRRLLSELGAALGDTIGVYSGPNAPEGFDLTIIGVLDGVSMGTAIVPIEIARGVFDLPGKATATNITSPLSGEQIEETLWAVDGVESVFHMETAKRKVTGNFEGSKLVLIFGIFMAIGIAVLFLGILAGLDAVDRAPDLAVLQAVGWRDSAVLGLCLTEVMTRGLLALIIAVPLAPVLGNWLLLRIGEANFYKMRLESPSWVTFTLIGLAVALIPLGAIPAYRASRRVTPARAMRMLTRE